MSKELSFLLLLFIPNKRINISFNAISIAIDRSESSFKFVLTHAGKKLHWK